MKINFDSLKISIVPNRVPTWTGTVKDLTWKPDVRIITHKAPLTVSDGSDYVYIDIDLWINSFTQIDQSVVRMTGELFGTREISKLAKSAVITPCKSTFTDDESEQYEDFDIILAETFEEAVYELFVGTSWRVDCDCSVILDYPVVTEISPVLALNGSKLDQLANILKMLSPSNLWGQGLSYFINPFEQTILIVPPQYGDSATHTIAIEDVKVEGIRVKIEDLILPKEIYLQEADSAICRTENGEEAFERKEESYSYEVGTEFVQEDLDEIQISAKLSGEKITLGELVLKSTEIVVVQETTWIEIGEGTGVPDLTIDPEDLVPRWNSNIIVAKATEITSEVSYEYLLGPPYETQKRYDDSSEAIRLPGESTDEIPNQCFAKSRGGTRQQLARDNGPFYIDEDNHPVRLYTADGIRITKKSTISKERTLKGFSVTDISNGRPVSKIPDLNQVGGITTTNTEQAFSYDEDGNLQMERTQNTVLKHSGAYSVNESVRIITPVTEEMTAEITYSTDTDYDIEGKVINSTITSINAQLGGASASGPSPTSAFTSLSEKIETREELLKSYDSMSYLRLHTDGTTSDIVEDTVGNIYVSLENLTLEEMKAYLQTHYALEAKNAYYASFTSRFMDVRGAIGGHLKLTKTTDPNTPVIYDSELSKINVERTELFEKMAENPFRITGVALQWNGEKVPEVAIALCQLVT